MGKVKTTKWRRLRAPKTVRAKYQAAKRVKFKSVELIREADYKDIIKQ